MISVSGAFLVWVIGNSRNHDNWHLTTVKQMRNVLRLIVALSANHSGGDRVDFTKDPTLFEGCTGLRRKKKPMRRRDKSGAWTTQNTCQNYDSTW